MERYSIGTKKAVEAAGLKYLNDELNGKVGSNFVKTYLQPFSLAKTKKENYIAYWHKEIGYRELQRRRHEETNMRRAKVKNDKNEWMEETMERMSEELQNQELKEMEKGVKVVLEWSKVRRIQKIVLPNIPRVGDFISDFEGTLSELTKTEEDYGPLWIVTSVYYELTKNGSSIVVSVKNDMD